jgi:hypothetical protein
MTNNTTATTVGNVHFLIHENRGEVELYIQEEPLAFSVLFARLIIKELVSTIPKGGVEELNVCVNEDRPLLCISEKCQNGIYHVKWAANEHKFPKICNSLASIGVYTYNSLKTKALALTIHDN